MNAELKPLVVRLNEARKIAGAFKADMEIKRLAWMAEQQPMIEAVALAVKAVAD